MVIYRIYNTINKKSYVGWTKNFQKRIKRHLYNLIKQQHHSHKLQRAFNKYGKDVFKFKILFNDEYISVKNILELEKFFVKKYDSFKNGYNCSIGGEGVLGIFGKDHWNSTPVYCYKIDGSFYKKFNTRNEAKNFFKNEIAISSVNKTCIVKKHYLFFQKFLGRHCTKFHTIFQYTKEGIFHASYMNTKTVVQNLNLKGAANNNINSVLTWKRQLAYNYIWKNKYCGKKIKVNLKPNGWYAKDIQSIKVRQIDIRTNKIINIFDSVTKATNFLKKRQGSLNSCLKGKTKTAYGFKWKYAA